MISDISFLNNSFFSFLLDNFLGIESIEGIDIVLISSMSSGHSSLIPKYSEFLFK